MDNNQLEDLKQFIDGRVSQAEVRLGENLGEKIDGAETRLGGKIKSLRTEMLDGFMGVGEAIGEINDRIDQFDKTKSPA